jgi:IS30 family transposase
LWQLSQGNPLCLQERESILRGLAQNESLRLIAERIGRSPSTVSREVARNGGKDAYSAWDAQDRADARRTRPKTCKLESDRRLHDGLAKEWSPQQIADRIWLAALSRLIPRERWRRVFAVTTQYAEHFVRHEAPQDRVGMKGPYLRPVAAGR